MALGITRTCFGGALSHQGLATRFASKFGVVSCLQSGIAHPRQYATASPTLTKKGPVTAKGTKNDAHLTPPHPKGRSVPKKQLKSTSPAEQAALHVFDPPHDAAAEQDNLSPEEQEARLQAERLKDVEKMMTFQHLMPTVDAWGQEVTDTLDVMVPRPVKFNHPTEAFSAIIANSKDSFKNLASLSLLVKTDALPGLYRGTGVFQMLRQLPQLFGTRSVEPDSILAPVRQMALELYTDLNEAIASRNDKEIKKYTTSAYQTQSLQLAKAFRNKVKQGRIMWQLHRTISPVQVLSIRVTEGYMAPDPPKLGNRLMVHALVKFDTEQSLEMYNSQGTPFHNVVTNPDRIVDSEKPKESWRVPAPRKRVTEYLVLEKRMWIQGPWQFREQIWPDEDA